MVKPKFLSYWSILFLVLFSGYYSEAQTFSYKQFYKQSGLSSSDITCITQDHLGFIWIGTENGINRYDGYNFKQYLRESTDSTSICHKSILSFYIDSHNEFWIGTPYGLNRYNRLKDNFYNYYFSSDSVALNSVKFFFENKKGELFVISTEGVIFKYNKGNDSFEYYKSIGQRCVSVSFVNDSEFWFGCEKGLFLYSLETYTYKEISNSDPQLNIFGDKGTLSLLSEGDNLWIGTKLDGLYCYSLQNKSLMHFSDNILSCYFIKRDKEGTIWVGEGDGLFYYSGTTQSFNKIKFPDIDVSLRQNATVTSLFEDNHGNFWLGIRYKGLGFMYHNKAFTNYYTNGIEPYLTDKDVITALLSDSNENIWAGFFHSGIDVINEKNKERVFFDYEAKSKNQLNRGSVFKIYESSDKKIYICLQQGGLQEFIPESSTFKNINLKIAGVNNSKLDIRSIDEDGNGNFWIVLHGTGLVKFNKSTGQSVLYETSQGNPNTVSNNWMFQVFVDSKNRVWVTSAHGISRYIDKDIFKQYTHIATDTSSIDNSFVNTIYEDSENRIWVGTIEGLNLYNEGKDNFYRISNRLKTFRKNILSILDDNRGRLWIGTNDGLFRYNFENDSISEFNIEDGLLSNEFLRNSCSKSKSGKLYFGHSKGFTCFYPDSILANPFRPPVYVVDIKLFNESFQKELGRNILEIDKVELQYRQNVISFEFAALNFISPGENAYAYMLEGFDNSWRFVGSKRDVTYTNLNPGKYTFRVKAANNDGLWNEKPYSIQLIIHPPFWRTLWFTIFLILVGIALIIGIIILRTRQFHKRNKLLETLVENRTSELSEKSLMLLEQTELLSEKNTQLRELIQMRDKFVSTIGHDLRNPLGTMLSLIELIYEDIDKIEDEEIRMLIGSIRSTSVNTLELLENILQWGRSQSDLFSVNIQKVVLSDIIPEIILGFKEQIDRKCIKINNLIEKSNYIVLADINMLKSIFRNLISNAIKYTSNNGEISLLVNSGKTNNKLVIGIKDTGIGMSDKKLKDLFKIDNISSQPGINGETGSGFGLLLCYEYVVKMKGEIWAESNPGLGSVFYFSLPFSG